MACNIAVGLPVHDIKWYKNGISIESNTRISTDEHTLAIENATIDDNGEFKCFGANRVGNATKSFKLKIITKLYAWIGVGVALVLLLAIVVSSLIFLARLRRVKYPFPFALKSRQFDCKTFCFSAET